MSLTPGTRLGPYEITAQIGVGGMGEVYRATDTKLDRDVAIKVLPASLADDPDRIARFQREAKTLASLNHPNIAAIHGLEDADGIKALVMELVEGPTLADRIAQGAIPVDEALPIAKQIAEALEAAHEQGIIHRDLKPANIKVRPDGTVKVLDFGLAKALEPTGAMSPGMSQQAPTITTPAMTQAGMILGTAAYMSPEQARGKPVDKRSDIWAFGAVLFEMLSGRRAFEDEDVSMTLSKVLQREPDFDALPVVVPTHVRQTLRLCLRKPLKERVPDIGAVRLADGAFETTAGAPSAPMGVQAAPPSKLPWVAVIVLAVIATGATAWGLRPSPAGRMARFEIVPPASEPLEITQTLQDLAISPDGTRIVYTATDSRYLYVRALDQIEPVELVGMGDTRNPFFSPDGTQVGFHVGAGFSLRRVSIQGGPPQTIVGDVGGNLLGASWGPDNTIVYATTSSEGLMRVAAVGGEPTALTTVEQSEGPVIHSWPEVLPDGRGVLFTAWSGSDETSQIVALNLETGEQEVLISGGTSPRYASSGHLLYAAAGSVWAVPFDIDDLEVTGDSVPVLENVTTKLTGAANFVLAQDGSLVYVSGGIGGPERTFVWVSRDGREEPVAAAPADYQEFTLSPDGTRVAVHIGGGEEAVWIYDLVRDTSTRLTFESDEVPGFFPTWTPDGTRVAFGPPLSWKRADGIGAVERLDDAGGRLPHAFSPDGTTLVFEERGTAGGAGLGVLTLEGDRTATLVINGESQERNAALSPDGRWVAYNANETGLRRRQVYVRPFPDVDSGRWQVSTDGGDWPVWNPAGGELFYRGPTGMMALAFETEPTFAPGALTQLFEWNFVGGGNRRMAVSPDGQRFLLLTNAPDTTGDEAAPSQLIVVQNWTEELKRLVPN